ncbi:lysophospholipid acyltransferase family protein [Rhizobiales bacterium Sp-1]|uniref:Lysophospholipid acyltransferase family protein n=1 Tax=Segnochrobactrum spirostomi TaxID=2608987 RepID=A0A6A7Y436_9HYPH|nr:lysophospholipid acyltransferase family protein [Segnochrobactrum spirostomi]
MLKKVGRAEWIRRLIGELLAAWLVFVWRTNKVVYDPPDCYDRIRPDLPVLVAMWHGQHFMAPFVRPKGWDVRVMISRSVDGEINAVAAKRLGMGLIRASGGRNAREIKKRGGVRGFLEVLRALREGGSVALTADVPKVSRVVGDGIVQLAERSGRPIMPIAFASSRRRDFDTWDKSTLNLPFGRCAIVLGDLIPPPKDETEREAVRQAVAAGLDAVTARAHELVDRRHG